MNSDTIRKISKERKEPDWLLDLRLKAFSRCENEDFLVKKDAKSRTKIKNSDFDIMTFEDALKKYEDILKDNMKIRKADDCQTLLTKAIFNEGIFVYIGEDQKFENPFLLNLDLDKDTIRYILIVIESNSQAKIIENLKSYITAPLQRVQLVEIIIKANSKVKYFSIQDFDKETNNISHKRAFVLQDAQIDWIECCLGSGITNSSTITNLQEEGARSTNLGIFYGDKDQNFSIDIKTIHNAPYTYSNMLNKGVLNDSARTKYDGLIRISEGSHYCQGFQRQDTILLSKKAKMHSTPNLEIHNKDVRCSHGTSIGKIDDEKIFYMMSRGMDEKLAKKMIVAGFFDPILSQMENKDIAEDLKESITKRIGAAKC